MKRGFFHPVSLDLSKRLNDHGCDAFKLKPFYLDKYHYLIDSLYLRKVINKKAKWTDYQPVNAKVLERIVTPQCAVAVKNDLVSVRVLEKSRIPYRVGSHSMSYRFADEFRDADFKLIPISDEKLIRRIERQRFDDISAATRQHEGRKLIAASMARLRFDATGARKHILGCNYTSNDSRACRLVSVGMFEAREFFFTSDEQGRVYHNFTSLPSDLRRFATFEGRGLFAIDVGNCQPALLSRLYFADSAEKRRYVALVKENRFYGHLNAKLSLPYDLSDSAEKRKFKELVFHKIFYGSNWGEAVELTHVFRREFPRLFDSVRHAKERHHRDLPVALQKLEAETVIDGVASEFARKHIGETVCLISLHDCLVSTEEHVGELKAMIENAFLTLLEFAPPVRIEQFSADAVQPEFAETLIAA
jgi:hypothetical protein